MNVGSIDNYRFGVRGEVRSPKVRTPNFLANFTKSKKFSNIGSKSDFCGGGTGGLVSPLEIFKNTAPGVDRGTTGGTGGDSINCEQFTTLKYKNYKYERRINR